MVGIVVKKKTDTGTAKYSITFVSFNFFLEAQILNYINIHLKKKRHSIAWRKMVYQLTF